MTLEELVEVAGETRSDDERQTAKNDLKSARRAGIHSVAQLLEALVDPRQTPQTRLVACSLLVWLGEPDAIAAFARALEEAEDDGVVWEVAKGLISLRGQSSAPTVVRVLDQGNPSKRAAAAYVLGWLGVREAVPALVATATNTTLEAHVRGHAIEALGVMGARETLPQLLELLSDRSPEVRYWAAYSVGEFGDPTSIPALEHMAANDSDHLGPPVNRSLRQEAREALEAIRARERDNR
jgi:HEAT repeat protein